MGFANWIGVQMLYTFGAACWSGQVTASSVSSTTAFVTTPTILAQTSSALTYYKLQVSINAAWNSVTCYVNGMQIGAASTTNIPQSLAIYPFLGAIKSAGTTANWLLGDTFAMVALSSSDSGQQQNQGTGFSTGEWSKPAELFRTGESHVLRLESKSGVEFIEVKDDQIESMRNEPDLKNAEMLTLKESHENVGRMKPMEPMN